MGIREKDELKNFKGTTNNVDLRTLKEQIHLHMVKNGTHSQANRIKEVFKEARDRYVTLRKGFINNEEVQPKDFLRKFLQDGYKLRDTWLDIFGNIFWYEKIVFCNGARILAKFPEGIAACASDNIEDYNRKLKFSETTNTFSGLFKFVCNILKVGEVDENLVFAGIRNYNTLEESILFPNCKSIPFDSETYSKILQHCIQEVDLRKNKKTQQNKEYKEKKKIEKQFGFLEEEGNINNESNETLDITMSERINQIVDTNQITKMYACGKLPTNQTVGSTTIRSKITQSEIQKLARLLESSWTTIVMNSISELAEQEEDVEKSSREIKPSNKKTHKFSGTPSSKILKYVVT